MFDLLRTALYWKCCSTTMSTELMQRGLLLLVCVVFFELQCCQTGPLDFVCSPAARSNLNIIEPLKTAMLQQKRASVCTSLGVFLHAVGSAKSQLGLDCQAAMLKHLKHNVQNHLKILNNLEIQGAPGPPQAGCRSHETNSLTKTLDLYSRLLQGQMELLLLDLYPSCP